MKREKGIDRGWRNKKSLLEFPQAGFFIKSGGTYFHAFGTIIGSESLTSVFGMGTGVTFPICSPEETGGRYFTPSGQMLFGSIALRAIDSKSYRMGSERARYRWPSIRPLVLVS